MVVGGRDKRVHGVDRVTGKGKWEFRARSRVDGSPLICAGKHVVVGADDGYLYVLDLVSGEELWSYEIGASVKTSPAVAGGLVLVGADDGCLYAFAHGKSVEAAVEKPGK
jgi:outer membrane protein assembly factor BamB